jgi:hypothetical protein
LNSTSEQNRRILDEHANQVCAWHDGQLRPKPAQGDASPKITLPSPQKDGGMPLMEAISKLLSAREFAPKELPPPRLSNLYGRLTELIAQMGGGPRHLL